MNETIIETHNLHFSYNGQPVISGVNLKIQSGDFMAMIGPNGGGKTTLLKLMLGLLKADSGSIRIFGKPPKEVSYRIGYVPQDIQINQNFPISSSDVVLMGKLKPGRGWSRHTKEDRMEAVQALERVGVGKYSNHRIGELSIGQKQRVFIARALVTDPKIVLIDERTTGQDPIRRNTILGMIAEYQKKFDFTAVLISHDIPDVFFISNQILALYDKKIVFQGTPEAFEEFDHPFYDEIVTSIENLQQELTGLHSRRQFKVRYQTDLSRRNGHEHFAVLIFVLEDLDRIIDNLGHEAAQSSIRTMGDYINKHFGSVGGFSARRSINQFGTVLPFSNLEEAERILADFTRDFQKNGLIHIENAARKVNPSVSCFEFSISAGLAKGQPNVELDAIMEFAEFKKEPIAQFLCNIEKN